MTDAERIELVTLKKQLTAYLETLHQQIITFSTDGDDKEFAFLITKTKNYRDVLQRVDNQLQTDELL